MKFSKIKVIFLIIFFILFVYGGYCINSNFNSKDVNKINIYISYIGLFATFGGAYLGAKISGQYTMKSLKISENNKKIINKKRAFGLKKELIKVTKVALNKARPQDGSGMFTFEEDEYIRVRDIYINKINENLKQISDFKMSENYYYLDDEDINDLDNIYFLLSDLVFSIEDLNNRVDEGQNENYPEFAVTKRQYFSLLDELYKKYY
ncbi:hypothetical protein [Staphylococcus petrasii]|uniref:Uncharacterized protein n=1 Tax=Staphylococcus petrasii TaxID=1276936 RepID=A0ABY2L236_9STAP|nr:hypothetical protein [Staphylococcus petrasii]TGE18845.1 hypothetical protein BJR09_03085 [Staphylococcus petrasii]